MRASHPIGAYRMRECRTASEVVAVRVGGQRPVDEYTPLTGAALAAARAWPPVMIVPITSPLAQSFFAETWPVSEDVCI